MGGLRLWMSVGGRGKRVQGVAGMFRSGIFWVMGGSYFGICLLGISGRACSLGVEIDGSGL